MTNTPVFTQTPALTCTRLSGSGNNNSNHDGTGTLTTVFTAGANGSQISCISILAAGTIAASTAQLIRFYIYDGTNNRLYREINMPAVTPSSTVRGSSQIITSILNLPANYLLKASAVTLDSAGNQFDITVEAGHF